MLFPKEEEYIEWFKNAGFKDVQLKRIGPKWYRGVRRHGLIMGCSVTGVKPASGDSPLQVTSLHLFCFLLSLIIYIYALFIIQKMQLGPKEEDVEKPVNNPFSFLGRFLLGTLAAAWFVLVPIYMWIKDQIVPKDQPIWSISSRTWSL